MVSLNRTADSGSRHPLKIDADAPIIIKIISGLFSFNISHVGHR